MSIYQWLNEWSAWGWPVLAGHLWQATLFAGLIFLLSALFRRAPARVRYNLWLLATLKFVVPSFLFVYLVRQTGVELPGLSHLFHPAAPDAVPLAKQVAAPVIQFAETAMMSSGQEAGTFVRQPGIYGWLTIVWLAGCAFLLGRWCVRHRRIARSVRSGNILTGERELEILERVRRRLRLKRRIRLVVSHAVDELGVWGVWKPVLLAPENLLAHLTDEELETVLTHELAHVRRWDNLTGNLQLLLCSVFWFHPLVWLLDRSLLAERERACDDEVLRLGGASNVYAASLVKVSRFGLGLKTAGVSRAAGSHVRRRIERIMAPDVRRKLTLAHRLMMSAAVFALLLFSVGALLLNGAGVSAQGNPNGNANSITFKQQTAGDLSDERAPFHFNEAVSQEQVEQVTDQLAKAAEVSIRAENSDGAPLRIMEARVRVVPLGKEFSKRGEAEEVVSPSTLRLSNQTGRRITFVRVSLRAPKVWHDIVGFRVDITPRGEYVLRADAKKWMNTIKPGSAASLIAQVVAVQFEDGSSWGEFDAREAAADFAPAAPVAPDEETPPPDVPVAGEADVADGKYYPARFENPTGAPLIITDARSRSVARTADMQLLNTSEEACTLPVVTLRNQTGLRIVALKLRFKAAPESHAVTAFRVTIEPRASYVFRRDTVMSGSAVQMRVQVIGVQFEDGSVWGVLDSTINGRDEIVPVPNSISRAQPTPDFIVQPTPAAIAPRAEIAASQTPRPSATYTPPATRNRSRARSAPIAP